MVEVVVDASVLVASFLDHQPRHTEALEYIRDMEAGEHFFHLPRLALVETLAAVNRRTQRRQQTYVWIAKSSFEEWLANGRIAFYDLDDSRSTQAVDIALRDRLRGSDAVYAALAEELQIPVKTFDTEIQQRYTNAVP